MNYIANPKILRAAPGGARLWNGENLAGPVTQATIVKKYEFEKPDWVKAQLHPTSIGQKLKAGQDVAAPITAGNKNIRGRNRVGSPQGRNRLPVKEQIMEF